MRLLAAFGGESAQIQTVAERGLGRLVEIAADVFRGGLAAAGYHGRRSQANCNGQSEGRKSGHVILLFVSVTALLFTALLFHTWGASSQGWCCETWQGIRLPAPGPPILCSVCRGCTA